MKIMRRLKLILGMLVVVTLMVGLLGLVGTMPVLAQAETVTVNTKDPVNFSEFVECANGGVGELVEFSGEAHSVIHITDNGHGGFNLKFLGNYQGVSGTGLTTGDKYQAAGGVFQTKLTGGVGEEQTLLVSTRFIGQGPGNNFLLHDNFHITLHADGTVTSFHDNFRSECK